MNSKQPSKLTDSKRKMLIEICEQAIESAYQDMQGVMFNRKGYRLRREELAKKLVECIEVEL